MAWTYSGNPASSDRDWIRFRLGDSKVETPQSLSDAELDYLLAEEVDKYMAASKAAEIMSAAYMATSVTQKQVGDLRLSYGYADTGKRYAALAKELAGGEARGIVGLLSTDDSPGYFQIGMFDGNYYTDERVKEWE